MEVVDKGVERKIGQKAGDLCRGLRVCITFHREMQLRALVRLGHFQVAHANGGEGGDVQLFIGRPDHHIHKSGHGDGSVKRRVFITDGLRRLSKPGDMFVIDGFDEGGRLFHAAMV